MAGLPPELDLPTERHQRFLRRVFDHCAERRLGLGLLGSVATGAAGRFSDIDLALSADATADDLRLIAEGDEKPVMGFFTVNPKGVLTVAYARAFCVEIGVRRTVARDETGFRSLLAGGFAYGAAPELIDVASLYDPGFTLAHGGLRVLYKAALKYLRGKHDTASALLGELAPGTFVTSDDFSGTWKALLDDIRKEETVPRPAAEEFDWLFRQM